MFQLNTYALVTCITLLKDWLKYTKSINKELIIHFSFDKILGKMNQLTASYSHVLPVSKFVTPISPGPVEKADVNLKILDLS